MFINPSDEDNPFGKMKPTECPCCLCVYRTCCTAVIEHTRHNQRHHPPTDPLLSSPHPHPLQPRLLAYAGVGVVSGSDPEAEWQELCLKARQFEALLAPRPALGALPNAQLAWAAALVEELCRLGVSMFCIAPGEAGFLFGVGLGQHRGEGGMANCYDRPSRLTSY